MERAIEVGRGELGQALVDPGLADLLVADHRVPPLVGGLVGHDLAAAEDRAAQEHDARILVARALPAGLGDHVARPLVVAERRLEARERGRRVRPGRSCPAPVV